MRGGDVPSSVCVADFTRALLYLHSAGPFPFAAEHSGVVCVAAAVLVKQLQCANVEYAQSSVARVVVYSLCLRHVEMESLRAPSTPCMASVLVAACGLDPGMPFLVDELGFRYWAKLDGQTHSFVFGGSVIVLNIRNPLCAVGCRLALSSSIVCVYARRQLLSLAASMQIPCTVTRSVCGRTVVLALQAIHRRVPYCRGDPLREGVSARGACGNKAVVEASASAACVARRQVGDFK